MYLKSIEMQGFKSFANKMHFDFHQGITAIVGPNGSGKSNVADAVRWVLGEQSAKSLRSGNMQDVIFAGTELRKPMSFASVSITFDNEDHKLAVDSPEVEVTRRLYRSGESEYLLNGKSARLKEIRNIFYDTGIGKEGYSIIGQGQVERILNGKPEERRALFDEAAGIVKFKKRKAETIKKLDDNHQNMLRITDILKELTGQLEPLKRQSAQAKIYLDDKEKLKALDINLFQVEEKRCEKNLKEIAERTSLAENDTRIANEELEKTKNEYSQVEQKLDDLDRETGELRDQTAADAVTRQQLQGQIEVLSEQIRSLKTSRAQFGERTTALDESLAVKRTELAQKQKELEKTETDSAEVAEKEEAARKELDQVKGRLDAIGKAVQEEQDSVIDLLNERSSVNQKIQKYDTMAEQMGIQKAGFESRLIRIREEEQNASGELKESSEKVAEIETDLSKAQKEQEAQKEKTQKIQAKVSQKNQELVRVRNDYHRDASRLEALKGMAERYEGYSLGIRKVMEQKNRVQGIRGVVADLIEVPKEYEQAIEIALGGSVRNVVTEDESSAKQMIAYLKQNRYGRVTFLPLNALSERTFTNRNALHEPGVIGVASDLVHTEPEYDILKRYLLGRTLIVDNVDHAIAIGRKYRHSLFMVTLEGESFSPGGSMTGGAFKTKENLLGRRREIDDLENRVRELSKNGRTLAEEAQKLEAENSEAAKAMSSLGESIQQLTLKLRTAQMTKKQAEENLRLNRVNASTLEAEERKIVAKIEEIKEKKRDAQKSLADAEEAEKMASERSGSLKEETDTLTEKQADLNKTLESLHVDMAAQEQQTGFLKDTVSRLGQEIDSLEHQKQELSENLASGNAEEEEKTAKIHELEEEIKENEAQAAENEKHREELLRQKQELSDSHKDFFEKRDALSEQLSRLDRELYRLNSQKERFEETQDSITSYMWDEYELTPSQIRGIELPEKNDDRQVLKKEINRLKDQIRKLGSVNVNAVEEFREVSKRHEFLSNQYNDLTESEASLKGIIEELDRGMRKQFTENFGNIQKQFDTAFRELFGGGHGTLEIDPDADILEADINIIAHPPGKTLQNMMQLSGGEKALTAIALLFAIQNLKPSPFCLLDEIEAALDDSNVTRFAEYLHKLTKNTQFIIITHRRGTMTAADRLYGITMQEKGVSTLVSVSLIENKLSN